jgi:hypothetical protein
VIRDILVNLLAVAGTAHGDSAVQLPVAGLGDDPRLCDLGRLADPEAAVWLNQHRRFGIHPVASDNGATEARLTGLRKMLNWAGIRNPSLKSVWRHRANA